MNIAGKSLCSTGQKTVADGGFYSPAGPRRGNLRIALIPIFLFLSLIFFPLIAQAEAVLSLNGEKYRYNAGTSLYYLEDPRKKYSIEQVSSPAFRDRFTRSTVRALNFGFSNSAYWIRLALFHDSLRPASSSEWLIELDYPLLDRITVYERGPGGFTRRESGDMIPFNKREIQEKNFLFRIVLAPGETRDMYIRIDTASSSKFGVYLWEPVRYFTSEQANIIAYGMYYGVLLVMALYNLFLFVTVRDRNYILYVLYVISFFLARSSLDGFAFQYLWPGNPWWGNVSVPFFSSFSCLMVVVFSMNFLQTKKTMPNVHIVILGLIAAYVVTCLISLVVSYSISIRVVGFWLMTGSLFMLFTGYWSLRQGHRPARFYLLSWTFLLIGSTIFDLNKFGAIPSVFLTEAAQHIGSFFEVVLLSFALGDRINLERREKFLAQQLAVENLHKADRLKDEFLANTSHELRTPLNGIIGLAESLYDGVAGELPGAAKSNLSMIVASGRRLANLVNDILDFSKMKHKELVLDLQPVDFRQIVEIVLMLSRPLVQRKNIRMENLIPDDLPPVLGDENRLMQVMHNLIGNAVKFTESGFIRVDARALDGSIEVRVSDSGIGIPPDRLGDIFRSFEQVDASIAREYGGTGLGLAITKDLIELHKGTIRVDSRPGKGSIFTVTLPVADRIASRRPFPAAAHGEAVLSGVNDDLAFVMPADNRTIRPGADAVIPGMEGVKVLAVDDEPVNLQVIQNNLVFAGIEVRTAQSGYEALEIFRNGYLPDIVLLDIMMPRMNGYELCRTIRESHNLTELPIIFLTAKNQVTDLIEGFVYGANDYIPKPFTKNELLARIKNLVTLKRAISDREHIVAIEHDLAIARNILRSIIPETLPAVPGLDIQARYYPIDAIGGDFYDFHVIGDGRLGILVADVSGHGVSAALIAAMLKIAFSLEKEHADDPVLVLEGIRNTMLDKLGNQFVTASYLYIDLPGGMMKTARAGHLPTLILRKGENAVREIIPEGRIICTMLQSSFRAAECELHEGDRVILFTDGISEANNASREMYGDERFLSFIAERRELTAGDFSDAVIAEIAAWTGKDLVFHDDLTLIVVDVVRRSLDGPTV